MMETQTDRRTFMRRGAMGAGALWAVSLGEFMGRSVVEAAAIPISSGATIRLLGPPAQFRSLVVKPSSSL